MPNTEVLFYALFTEKEYQQQCHYGNTAQGVRTIALHRDGSLSTQDLRYRDLVGKKLQEPLHFAFFQIMPTNVYDAISRAVKIFAALGGM